MNQGEILDHDLPLVSVIVPTYNCAKYVDEAIGSVLEQDYPNKELIVVDDGSSDGTLECISRYASRLTLIRQPNRGPAAARNRGAAAATGTYVAFLDGDDVWLPGSLAARVHHFQANPSLAAVYGRWERWYPRPDGSYPPASWLVIPDSPRRVDRKASGWLYTQLLFDCIISTCAVLMRRSDFLDLGGFDESLGRGEDYDLWIRLSRRGRIDKLFVNCFLYRMHDSNMTISAPEQDYAYRVISNAVSRFGLSCTGGSTVEHELIERRLAQLAIDYGWQHMKRGDGRRALQGFGTARKHGARGAKLLSYELFARLRARWSAAPDLSKENFG